MQMTDKDKDDNKIEWQNFYLPNIPIYQTKLPQNIIDRLWFYVKNAKEKYNNNLAGNIDKSLLLIDEDDYFMNHVVGPIAQIYISHDHNISWVQKNHTPHSKSMVMDTFWVNFQNQNEFNPIHNHSGVISFVVWMKIPTHYKDQHQLKICKNSNCPSASDFQFTYSDILGNHQDHRIEMAPYQEGWMLVFPSQLRHQVYPYYNCDEQRISISGNISWNSMNLHTNKII